MPSVPDLTPRDLRRRSGLTQEELAAKAGVSVKTVNRLERRQPTSLRSRRAIAAALDVSLQELTPYSTQHPNPPAGSRVTRIPDDKALFAVLERCPATSIWVDEGPLPAIPDSPWWNPKLVIYFGSTQKLINTVVDAIESCAGSFVDQARHKRPVIKALSQLAALGWELRVVCHDSPPSAVYYLGSTTTLNRKTRGLRNEAHGAGVLERANKHAGSRLMTWLFTAAVIFLVTRAGTLAYGSWRESPFRAATEAAAATGNWPSEHVHLKQASVTVLPFFFLTDAQVTVNTSGGQELATVKIVHSPFLDFWVVRGFSRRG